eukprot:scaffold158351_cov15-Tisochrysis_lutea.AAC.1
MDESHKKPSQELAAHHAAALSCDDAHALKEYAPYEQAHKFVHKQNKMYGGGLIHHYSMCRND